MGRGGEYMPEERGLFCLHPDAGITFDLEAICKAHPSVIFPVRFCAFAGWPTARVWPTFWVFADGNPNSNARAPAADGPVRVEVRSAPATGSSPWCQPTADRDSMRLGGVGRPRIARVAMSQNQTEKGAANDD